MGDSGTTASFCQMFRLLWLYYLKLWMLKLCQFRKVYLQVPKLAKCWSWLFLPAEQSTEEKECIFSSNSFHVVLGLGTQVVIWPFGKAKPKFLHLVQKVTQKLPLWLCKAGLHFAWLSLPCLLCLLMDFHALTWSIQWGGFNYSS